MRLKKIKSGITSLEKKAEKTKADIKVRHDQKLNHIRGQYDQAREKIDELSASSQDAWLEIKTIVDEALDVLEEAVNAMTHRISEQAEN